MACPLLSFVMFLTVLALQLLAYCKADGPISDSSASAIGRLEHDDPFLYSARYNRALLNITMNQLGNITLRLEGFTLEDLRDYPDIQLKSERSPVATVLQGSIPIIEFKENGTYEGVFNVSGVFLGSTKLYVEVRWKNNQTIALKEKLNVKVVREERIIDKVFTGSVITLVSILYINFGAALDIPTLQAIARRPIGPVIGFMSQFLFMPLLSYGLGILLFPDDYAMQLGLFFTGVSPGGGASNMWTVLLGGNLNLSVAMTTISTFAAFGMMPLWLFTLGAIIFSKGNMKVPYRRIAGLAIGLVVPLGIGLLIQRYRPRCARFLVRILKPTSAFLILFIIIFASITNLYLFKLFSWRIIVAGVGVPWFGYMFGYIASKVARLPTPDALAIAVETGVQNTGIAIFMLRLALDTPDGDLTTVVPVSAAIMTPIPLLAFYLVLKIRERYAVRKHELVPNGQSHHAQATDELADEEETKDI